MGITLIALVITIIVILILSGVSLGTLFSQDGIFSRAEQATDKYGEAKKREGDLINNLGYNIDVAMNHKPIFDYIDVVKITANSATIKVNATDMDEEGLTYILYMGTDEKNLVEKAKKENIEQGIEVELLGEEIDTTQLYYYRVDVKDAYVTVQSPVSTIQNKKPILEKSDIIDITKICAKARIQGTDEDINDILTYRIIYGENKDTLDLDGRIIQKENIVSGTEEILDIEELIPGTKYYYKIEITDGKQIVHNNGEFVTIVNKKPTKATVKQLDTKKTSFNITARATDGDREQLEYKVYTGYSKDKLTTLHYTSPKTDSGVTITIPIINITANKEMYYRVDVSDGNETVNGNVFCPGTGKTCSLSKTCDNCKGTGKCSSTTYSKKSVSAGLEGQCDVCNNWRIY